MSANKFVLLHHGGGRPGPFYHIVHVSVYLGRQRGKRGPWLNIQNSSDWEINYKIKPQASFFNQGLLHPSPPPLSTKVDTDVILVIKGRGLHFCKLQVIKNWTVGRPGNKTTSNLCDCTGTHNDINCASLQIMTVTHLAPTHYVLWDKVKK